MSDERKYLRRRRSFSSSSRSYGGRSLSRQATVPIPRAMSRARFTANSIHKFARYVAPTFIQSSNAAVVETNYGFGLSDLPGYTEFTTLFDQYRFIGVKYAFLPRMNVNQMGTAAAGNNAPFYVTKDYDNTALITTVNAMLEFSDVQIVEGNRAVNGYIRPHIAVAAYAGSFTSYSNLLPQWIDSTSSGVIHYGLRTMVGITTAVNDVTYDVFFKYYIECRNTH